MENNEEHTPQWWRPNIRFDPKLGYVMLQLPELNLPPLTYAGTQFIPKDELHCSLLCIPKLAAPLSETGAKELENFVKEWLSHNEVSFNGFGKQLYLCEHEEVKTVVVAAQVVGIESLFAAIRVQFSALTDVPAPALHVTLYRFNHPFGIGIQNEAELQQLCKLIPETDLTEVRKVIHDKI